MHFLVTVKIPTTYEIDANFVRISAAAVMHPYERAHDGNPHGEFDTWSVGFPFGMDGFLDPYVNLEKPGYNNSNLVKRTKKASIEAGWKPPGKRPKREPLVEEYGWAVVNQSWVDWHRLLDEVGPFTDYIGPKGWVSTPNRDATEQEKQDWMQAFYDWMHQSPFGLVVFCDAHW